uniref:Insulin-like domain-containing protein n=3 Tax=Meloidogyne TaxID=189290 RepID=A0A914LPR3_MELIC
MFFSKINFPSFPSFPSIPQYLRSSLFSSSSISSSSFNSSTSFNNNLNQKQSSSFHSSPTSSPFLSSSPSCFNSFKIPQKNLQRINCFPPPTFLFLQIIIAALIIPMMANAETENPFPNDFEEHRICGRLLINALKTVCNHQYLQPTREQLYDNYYKNTGMVFRARRGSSSISEIVGGGTSRKRRGIIWECCTNKCSLNYIRNNYCAPGSVGGDEALPSWQFVEDVRRRRR